MRPECWIRQRSLSCSPWHSVCHDSTAIDATHNVMPGCENILAVTGSQLISVWILFVWYQKLKVTSLVVFRDEGTFGPTTEMLNRGSKSNPLTLAVMWIYPSRRCFLILCHRTHLYSTIWHSPDGKAHWNWTCFETCFLWDCMQYKVVIPFWYFGIANWSHF